MENVAPAGEARSAVACVGGTSWRYLRDRVESRWQVGIQGSCQRARGQARRPGGPPPLPGPTCVGARDDSGVCALAVHFITASKIKLGPDGISCQQAWQRLEASTAQHCTALHSIAEV